MFKKNNSFMIQAIKEANKSKVKGDWPVGCVIIIDGKIVATGRNKVYSQSNKILHAEIDAMLKIPELLSRRGKDATMYVTYEPCPMCLGAIILNHIKKVVCGTNVDKSGAFGMIESLPSRFNEDKYLFKFETGFMESECRDVFMAGDPVKKLKL
jgi:tRNA(adenine34) deaminase